MDCATPDTGPTLPDSELLVCLSAIGRALEAEFQPRAFLDDLSAALAPLVPHDRLAIGYVCDDGQTFSLFAEHGAPGFLSPTDRYTTDLERAARFALAGTPLADVVAGRIVCAADLTADARFAPYRERAQVAALRSALVVPLVAGTRVIGGLSAVSRTADAYGPVHVERLRALGRLIGPFIETIAELYRHRRRQHRIGLLKGITQMLGTSLDVRQMLKPVGDAIRGVVEFDTFAVILFKPDGAEYVLFGTVGEPPVAGVEMIPLSQFSYAATVLGGQPVLFQEASKEFDPSWAGDRIMLGANLESCLWVPMRFGEGVGGTLLFGKHEPYWYDRVDIDVATAIATRLALGIQHQRLAEEQRRVASVEDRARTLEHSLKSARTELHHRFGFEQMIGRSTVLQEALRRANQVARTDTTVLISGESGTGKELVARAIHYASPRADGPFVAVNCAALPDTLLESELFGHERGAFTGADRQRPGRFELAAHGTLFLDEIGELSPAVQVKLLRVLQEREFQRLGGTATLKADVRVIAASNRDLSGEMAAGRFRDDLFYRLSVFNVHLPPLRERGEDVLLLAEAFIRTLAARMGKGDITLSRDARELLQRHPWPGNIRELQNAIERGLITCEGTLVTAAHLAIPLASQEPTLPRHAGSPAATASSVDLQVLERKAILDALERTHGHKARAAALLGLTRFQLYSRLRRHNIEVSRD